MAEILPFKKKKISEKHKGNTLCKNGHHHWLIDKQQIFNVKLGRLVTVSRCKRCGISKKQYK